MIPISTKRHHHWVAAASATIALFTRAPTAAAADATETKTVVAPENAPLFTVRFKFEMIKAQGGIFGWVSSSDNVTKAIA